MMPPRLSHSHHLYPRAVICGAGIVGQTLAWELAKKNWSVVLLDQRTATDEASCSFVAGGMLAPYAELDHCDPRLMQLGEQALPFWQKMAKDLGQPEFVTALGSLIVAHPRDRHLLHQFAMRLPPHNAAWQTCPPAQIATLEPMLAERFEQGIFLPTEAHVDVQALMPSLRARLSERVQVQWSCTVHQVAPGIARTSLGAFIGDWVFDCRGLGSDDQDLRGVTGEIIRVKAPAVSIQRPVRLMHPRYPIFVIPRPHHQYLIGATHLENTDSESVSVRSALELLSAAYALHPLFGDAEIIGMHAARRPTYPDHWPRVQTQPGLIRINGLYRHGYLLTPALVQRVLQFCDQATHSHPAPQFVEVLQL